MYNTLNALNDTELFVLKWLILCYVNFNSNYFLKKEDLTHSQINKLKFVFGRYTLYIMLCDQHSQRL